jgi:hypothetical protein
MRGNKQQLNTAKEIEEISKRASWRSEIYEHELNKLRDSIRHDLRQAYYEGRNDGFKAGRIAKQNTMEQTYILLTHRDAKRLLFKNGWQLSEVDNLWRHFEIGGSYKLDNAVRRMIEGPVVNY